MPGVVGSTPIVYTVHFCIYIFFLMECILAYQFTFNNFNNVNAFRHNMY